jgi:hypothetical protein
MENDGRRVQDDGRVFQGCEGGGMIARVSPMELTKIEEGINEYIQQAYDFDRKHPNLLSNWYTKIKDVPGLKIPETAIIPVPFEVFAVFENDEIDKGMEVIEAFVEAEIIPRMDKRSWFIKNGCFSDKFDFQHAITNPGKVLDDFVDIQYNSACFETGGVSEIILREIIPWDEVKTATIYYGLPLRTEIRVFYDFDARRVLYAVNYWDFDYCRPYICSRTDQIIFDATKDEILAGYEKHKERVTNAVDAAMRDVEMSGNWSIDILVDDRGNIWLIDMAQAERSAYWKTGGRID